MRMPQNFNIAILCVLFLSTLCYAKKLQPDFSLIKKYPKSRSLDLNRNSTDDYFRIFYANGKVQQVSYDINEDGKVDYIAQYDKFGLLVLETVDGNFDNKVDFKQDCRKSKCTIEIDYDFDGKFDKTIKEGISRRQLQKFFQEEIKALEKLWSRYWE